jgi:hypothetical protein
MLGHRRNNRPYHVGAVEPAPEPRPRPRSRSRGPRNPRRRSRCHFKKVASWASMTGRSVSTQVATASSEISAVHPVALAKGDQVRRGIEAGAPAGGFEGVGDQVATLFRWCRRYERREMRSGRPRASRRASVRSSRIDNSGFWGRETRASGRTSTCRHPWSMVRFRWRPAWL